MNNRSCVKVKYQDLAFAAAMTFMAAFLLWKCRYGFANKDESLYLVIPFRFFQGDGMFVHEWNLSQLSSFILLPFVQIYMAIMKTTEGILLNFRYIFTAVQGLCAVLVYIKLKRYNWLGAFISALVFFAYAPFGIMALSYNSMGIQCVLAAMLLVLTNDNGKKLPYIAAGVLFAAAVLCCPFLVIVYGIYSILALINYIKKGCFKLNILSKEGWIYSTLGIAATAAVFLMFVLSRASISDIITALQWMLNDPQHRSQSMAAVLMGYVKGVLFCSDISVYLYAGFALLLAAYKLTRKKGVSPALFYCAGAILTGLFMLPFVTWEMYINRVMFPLNIFGLFCVFLTDNAAVKQLFKLLWVPGMLYSVCIHMASTEGFLNIASVSTISLMASIVIAVIVGRETAEKAGFKWLKSLTVMAVAALLTVQLGAIVYTRYVSVFWESGSFGGGMHTQTQTITQGVEKGIIVSKEKEKLYNDFMQDSSMLRQENHPQSVMFASQHSWMYLTVPEIRMGAFSAWLPCITMEEFEHSISRQGEYVQINPDKLPQAIYAEAQYREAIQEFTARYNYTETVTQNGNYYYTLD